MAIEIMVPNLGESIMEATVVKWHKAEGDAVSVDDTLCELETDKVTVEVPAPASGVLVRIAAPLETDIAVGQLLGVIEEGETAANSAPAAKRTEEGGAAREAPPVEKEAPASGEKEAPKLSPAVRKLLEENDLDAADIAATGAGGRLTKGDVKAFLKQKKEAPAASVPAPPATPGPSAPEPAPAPAAEALGMPGAKGLTLPPPVDGPPEERVRMSRLRRRIAERLKEAQNTAAILTTFNEVDMTAVMNLRRQHGDAFEKLHGVRLGYMSLFIKAAVSALQEFPAVNAEIQGDELVYRNEYHVGIAVGSGQGLVVPVLRHVGRLSIDQIETAIGDFGRRARAGQLALEELHGGTFTITNGGIFGSLLSTPILNMPQSGILGMHKIQQRAMVMPDGSIQARPMMYLALSYDHRIVDGREAVSFLVRIKECIDDPTRIMINA